MANNESYLEVVLRNGTDELSAELSTEDTILADQFEPIVDRIVNIDDYIGEYEVTPKMYEQTILETQNKRALHNIVVNRIPQYEVSNPAGGTTAIIGDEYYGS